MSFLKRATGALTRKHWVGATGIALLACASIPLQNSEVTFSWSFWRVAYHAPWFVLFGYFFLVAIAFVEASVAPGWVPSMGRYALGAVAATIVCMGTAAIFHDYVLRSPTRIVAGKVEKSPPKGLRAALSRNYAVLGLGFDGPFHGFLATLIYGGLRRSRYAERNLADAQLARAQASHRIVSARLDAGQAAIDPASVRRALDAIEAAYDRDPASAESLMDALIERLRAAIPTLRADSPRAADARASGSR